MFFNTPVFSTQDIKRYNEACEKLAFYNIAYSTRTSDRTSSTSPLFAIFGTRRSRTGTFGETLKLTYSIYVKRRDRNLAKSVLISRPF